MFLDIFEFCVLDDFFRFSKKSGFGVFLVYPPMASVLLSASVERCFVSRMRDFFCWKYTETSIFLEKFIGQWVPDRNGREIARNIEKKIISIFKTWQKMVTKFGQFKKLKCPNFVNCPNFVTIFSCVLKMKIIFLISLAIPCPTRSGIHWQINFSQKIDDSVYFQKKKIHNWREEKGPGTLLFSSLVVENIQSRQFFLEKLIGKWILYRDGRGIARDVKKNYFHFQNATKNGNKVGTIDKLGTFQLFKLSKLCYHFLSSFKNENYFFYIPRNPLPIAVRNSLTNQFFQTKLRFSIFSTKKGKTEEKRRVISTFFYCPDFVTIFCQVLKMEIFFFDIPSIPPPIAVQNSLTNQFFQKKLMFLYIFNKQKKLGHVYIGISILVIPGHVTSYLLRSNPPPLSHTHMHIYTSWRYTCFKEFSFKTPFHFIKSRFFVIVFYIYVMLCILG